MTMPELTEDLHWYIKVDSNGDILIELVKYNGGYMIVNSDYVYVLDSDTVDSTLEAVYQVAEEMLSGYQVANRHVIIAETVVNEIQKSLNQ